MNENLTAIKAAIAAFFTALGAFLGWQGVMIFIWLGAMLLDYLSGTLAAWLSGEWSSAVARDGIKHKAGMVIVVIVAGIADLTLTLVCEQLPVDLTWPVLVLPLVLAWYILTELGSILENAVKMGAPIPSWLTKALKVGLKAINSRAEVTMDDTGTTKLNGEPTGTVVEQPEIIPETVNDAMANEIHTPDQNKVDIE